jgi:crotonobetainyl-CoA:carnitine CoA-transferase CaiB-like acyl-CoA transferase
MPETYNVTWADQPGPVTGPLRGVRVLDLTTVVMGPFATQILGDLGADVVKIETAGGDSTRGIGPFKNPGMGPLYLWANRNKRSLVLDLKSPEGKAAAIKLAESADVLVSNVRPQGLARLGLDYESLRQANPKIIYCSAVGYGAGGPQAGKAVYDDLMQAAAGVSGLFQQVDGTPRYAPANFCDRIVGLYVVNSITAALYHKAMTGEGQAIEVPMFETMSQFILSDHAGGKAFEPRLGEMGYKRLLSRTRGPYPTKDGFLAIVVYTNKHWEAFTQLIGMPDLLSTDERFANMTIRNLNSELMGSFLSEQLQARTTAEWLVELDKIDIPACPVNSLEDLFEDPHLKAVGFFSEMEHPTEGTLNVARFPVKYSASPASIRRLAPNLGEHNQEFLQPATAGDLPSAPEEAAE